jgi:hypothetical protein
MTHGYVQKSQFTDDVGTEEKRWWSGEDRPQTAVPDLVDHPTPLNREFYADPKTGRIVPKGDPGCIQLHRKYPKRDPVRKKDPSWNEPHNFTSRVTLAEMPTYMGNTLTGVVSSGPCKEVFYNYNLVWPHEQSVWALRAKLINDLYSKAAGSGFNTTIFASQIGQTLSGIGDAAIAIANSARRLRRGDFYGAAMQLLEVGGESGKPLNRHPKASDLAGRWLELQYGWLPLLSDVHESAELLAHNMNVTAQGGSPVEVRGSYRDKGNLEHVAAEGQWEVKHAIKCKATLRPLTFPQLVGLTDPLSLVWENIPFSFVVDWFYPIGDYLAAVSQAQALRGEFVTSELVTTRNTYVRYNGGSWWLTPNGRCLSAEFITKRTVSQSLSISLPPLELGGISSVKRALNALSLLSVSFQR